MADEFDRDSEVERLQRLLAPYRFDPERTPLVLPPRGLESESSRRRRRWPFVVGGLAAAALILVVGSLVLRERSQGAQGPRYPVIGVAGRSSLGAGEELVTEREARVEIEGLGEVSLAPGARFAVRRAEAGKHRFFLGRGALRARILAPPGVFRIDTPAGDALDLGCAYTLLVDDLGISHLDVTEGRVLFLLDGREVYVPAGAGCSSTAERGPSPPVFDEADESFKEALARVAFEDEPLGSDVDRILAADDRLYGLSLFHLLDAPSSRLRRGAFELLSKWYPKPPGVTEEGVLEDRSGQRAAWMEEMVPSWRR